MLSTARGLLQAEGSWGAHGASMARNKENDVGKRTEEKGILQVESTPAGLNLCVPAKNML